MASAVPESISGSVLVIPSISIANIPQLASDLLIHTLDFVKVATLSDKYLYPFVSPVDYTPDNAESGPKGISLGLEVYFSEKHQISMLQQRSPLIPGFALNHVEEVLVPFIEAGKFKHIVFLSLSDAGLVEHIAPGGISIYTNEDLLNDSLTGLHISESEIQPLGKSPGRDTQYEEGLVKACSKNGNFSIIVSYVYEGDNFFDAHVLATKVAEVLEISPGPWKTPVSWFGVYGDKPAPLAMEDGLYG